MYVSGISCTTPLKNILSDPPTCINSQYAFMHSCFLFPPFVSVELQERGRERDPAMLFSDSYMIATSTLHKKEDVKEERMEACGDIYPTLTNKKLYQVLVNVLLKGREFSHDHFLLYGDSSWPNEHKISRSHNDLLKSIFSVDAQIWRPRTFLDTWHCGIIIRINMLTLFLVK